MSYRTARASLLLGGLAAAAAGAGLWRLPAQAGDAGRAVPPLAAAPATPAPKGKTETAVLAGGCFWGVQAVFQHVRGVTSAVSGYAGGKAETAAYDQVSTGMTGHAESVRITFDPSQISYPQILQVFFSVALDPTEVNRQGPDVGPQYRSEVFYASPEQQRAAEAYIAQLDQSRVFSRPIATRVDPLDVFYPAEAYHQDYLVRHPNHPYIVINDQPKVQNLKRLFPSIYREAPVTVASSSRQES